GKTDVRSFPDRKNIEIERFTFGFTIRDSAEFFINVSAWGGEAFISGLADSFSMGDCVIIENPLVSTKDPEKGDKFCPATPSHYRLLLTETHSQVSVCGDGASVERLLPLLHLPVKDNRDFYSLADIVANGQQLDSAVINVLAAVKLIGETKQFVTSDGRRGQRLELKLFDDSVSSFPLISWDREAIQLLQNLVPRETVLFVADAKMSFDSFRGSMVATVTSKTIITVNPDTREASLLFSYVKELSESGALDQDEALEDPPGGFQEQLHSLFNLDEFIIIWNLMMSSITAVFTVKQLKQKARENVEPFFCLAYGFVSKLDLDSSVSKVTAPESCTAFDLLVDVTDHTGTLQACSLRGPVAEQTLGCTIFPSARMKSGMRGTVLDCSLADPGEVKQSMSALLQEQ
uniref:Meiosis specific with OB-fold n=1 Tax=Xiphophorus couchianus TaxID=32473 RepID=A0A3B5L7P7_9TELE